MAEGDLVGVAEVTVRVADTMFAGSLQPLGGVDIAHSNTSGRSGVDVGSLVIQQRNKSNNTDELTQALSLTSGRRSERKLVMFTDVGLDHGGTGSAAGQFAAVIAQLGGRKLTMLAKQGVCQGPREWMPSHRSGLMAVVLGVAMLRVWAEWEGPVEVWLDNEAVVRGCQQLVTVGAEAVDAMFHSGRNLRQGEVPTRCALKSFLTRKFRT